MLITATQESGSADLESNGRSHALAGLVVDTAAATDALRAIGIEPAGMLAAALVHAATDVLIAVCVARTLPPGADFEGALSALDSLTCPQPLPVLRAQVQLLAALRAVPNEPTSVEDRDSAPTGDEIAGRLGRLGEMLEGEVCVAEQAITGAGE